MAEMTEAEGTTIGSFTVDVPEAELDELRRRVQETRWERRPS